jgi:hypothetical protein
MLQNRGRSFARFRPFGWLPQIWIEGESGVWVDRTPAALNLAAGPVGDRFGVQDILPHPIIRGRAYMFSCYEGCWRTDNFGKTWYKVSGSSILDGGKNWGSAIAPVTGSYLLNTCGNNFDTGGAGSAAEVRRTIQRSADGGETWIKSADCGGDPYNVEICKYDENFAIAALHDNNHFLESEDGGRTWTDHGVVNAAISNSGYVFYLHNKDTVLYQGTDSDPSFRGTKSGGVWTWTQITDLNSAGHIHGMSQMFHDEVNGVFYLGAGANVGNDGIFRSTNNGVNWTKVSSTPSSCIVGTLLKLYSGIGSPSLSGDFDPRITIANRVPGTSWSAPSDPGLLSGPKRYAVMTDGNRYCILAGSWFQGVLQYIEAA